MQLIFVAETSHNMLGNGRGGKVAYEALGLGGRFPATDRKYFRGKKAILRVTERTPLAGPSLRRRGFIVFLYIDGYDRMMEMRNAIIQS